MTAMRPTIFDHGHQRPARAALPVGPGGVGGQQGADDAGEHPEVGRRRWPPRRRRRTPLQRPKKASAAQREHGAGEAHAPEARRACGRRGAGG